MLNQSFRQVFVTNNTSLLADGQTVDSLAVGQVGVLDAKTFKGVTAPTYAKNKALFIVHGTPDLGDQPLMSGTYNQNEYSKIIVGKNIVNFRAKAAKRGQNQIITIGNSGDVSDTDTIFASNGEQRHLYLTLTGGPIDKLYSLQGITRHYIAEYPVNSDCTDVCAEVDRRKVAEDFISQINGDTSINKFVKASKIEVCDPELDAPDTQTVYVFQLTIADTQDDVALGLVQEAYPTAGVKRVGTQGILSIYEVQSTVNSAPDDFSNAGVIVIPDCDTCPTGYTLTPGGFVYKVTRTDDGDGTALTAVETDYDIADDGESVARIAYEFGQSTYVVVADAEIADAEGTDGFVFLGEARGSCVLDTPTETAWAAAGTLTEYGKVFRLTVGDDICGNNRLTELQALYPDLVITIVDAAGDCVHTYETTVYSNPVEDGCSVQSISWVRPPSFEGVNWLPQPDAALPDGTTCLLGIKIEVAFVNRVTNECTFSYFPYEADTVFVTASTFDPNYNNAPFQQDWVVKQIQSVQFPVGLGAHIRYEEQKSLGYALRDRAFDPVVRESQGYFFQAQPNVYYDEYVLEYDYSVLAQGWGQRTDYRYSQVVYFPEGTGKNFETAVNGYIASANISLDPVVI